MKQARDFVEIIKQSQFYTGGRQFSVDELQRSLNCLKGITTSRVRQLLNRMADDGLLDKVEMSTGHMTVEYRAKSEWRSRLLKPWAHVPGECQHSPRWF